MRHRPRRSGLRLRYRLYFTIIPLVIVVVVLSGVLSSLESHSALINIANRHMDFKAEQLRDYFYSEWDAITNLGLDAKPEYRTAIEESFRSYAFSLLRGDSERIFVFDSDGRPVMVIGPASASTDPAPGELVTAPVQLPVGWFSSRLFGMTRVGVAFKFDPFSWTVAVTDLESTYFSEVRTMQRDYVIILIVAIVVAGLFLSLFVRHIVRPVEQLTGTIGTITATNDLSRRVAVGLPDEIGTLAAKFNSMISALEEQYHHIQDVSASERRARQIAVEREEETLFLLARASEFRDMETGEHLDRIGKLSALMSKLLGQSEDEQELLRRSAPLHDIGKIGIPDAILLKSGRLTDVELERMRQHTLIGNKLLEDAHSVYLVEGAAIAMTHHEKWDGTGYPNGLRGEEIPLSGRIVSIVDVFDALLSSRPYKEAWPVPRVREYMLEQRGKHFDPDLVDLFMANFEQFDTLRKR